MSTTVTYKGATLTTATNQTRTLDTAGKYMEDDVTITDVTASATLQAKTNIAPTTTSQTITPDAGYDGLSSVQINAMPSGSAGTPTATKGTVSNHSVSVTPSVTNTTGYITGGTKSGTAVSVSASELVSGSQTITQNGTVDVTNLASVTVNVSGGGWQDISSSLSFTLSGEDYPVTVVYAISNGSYAFFDLIMEEDYQSVDELIMHLPFQIYKDDFSYDYYVGVGLSLPDEILMAGARVEDSLTNYIILEGGFGVPLEFIIGVPIYT